MRVTISGADNVVSPHDLGSLSTAYPFVEWGILYSEKRVGTSRYPTVGWMHELFGHVQCRLALHLCGSAARKMLAGDPEFLPKTFRRIQLNGYKGVPNQLHQYNGYEELILQVQNEGDLLEAEVDARGLLNASLVYDPSGGQGLYPHRWPIAPSGVRMGIAGGINPDNVVLAVEKAFRSKASWIDMESGVRDDDDRLDLDKVRDVLSKVSHRFHGD